MSDNTSSYTGNWLIIAVIVFLVAIFPMPYEYYMLLRVGSLFLFAYLIYKCVNMTSVTIFDINFLWIFAGFLVVYNPLLPISLTKALWIPINVITAVAILVFWVKANNLNRKPKN